MSDNFFQDDIALVTASVVRIGGETFSTPLITSVRVQAPSNWRWLLVPSFGYFAVQLFSAEHPVMGLLCLVPVAAAPLARARLFVATAGGERRAIIGDAVYCYRVRDAIIKAMQAVAQR